MSADDITVGGRRRPDRPTPRIIPSGPAERPTVRIAAADEHETRPYDAPRAIDLARAQEIAADILTGSAGLMHVGQAGIRELAWFVARLDPASVADPVEDMITVDLALDPADVGAAPVLP